MLLYPESEVAAMGAAAFQQIRSQVPTAQDPGAQRYLQCIVGQLVEAMQAEGVRQTFEVELFEDPSVNAFALPGGKIGVHTGMLRVAETPGQLAAVLAHEVAHVIAQHTNERLSTTAVAQTGLSAVQVLLGGPSTGRDQLMAALGLGAQVGLLLPFSRTQESEADVLGLRLMARAGFDPEEAVALWRRMEMYADQSPPEFLSTHPSEETRIDLLRSHMPEALRLYGEAVRQGQEPRCSGDA